MKIWHRDIIRENKIPDFSSYSLSSREQNILERKTAPPFYQQVLVVELAELTNQFGIFLSFVHSTRITILQILFLIQPKKSLCIFQKCFFRLRHSQNV